MTTCASRRPPPVLSWGHEARPPAGDHRVPAQQAPHHRRRAGGRLRGLPADHLPGPGDDQPGGHPDRGLPGRRRGLRHRRAVHHEPQRLPARGAETLVTMLKGVNRALGDGRLESTIEKIHAIVPESLPPGQEGAVVLDFTPWGGNQAVLEKVCLFRRAIEGARLVSFNYLSLKGEDLRRTVEPVVLVLKGFTWYLYAWCRHRGAFRLFRLSRVSRRRAGGGALPETGGGPRGPALGKGMGRFQDDPAADADRRGGARQGGGAVLLEGHHLARGRQQRGLRRVPGGHLAVRRGTAGPRTARTPRRRLPRKNRKPEQKLAIQLSGFALYDGGVSGDNVFGGAST